MHTRILDCSGDINFPHLDPGCNRRICAWRFWMMLIESVHVLLSKVYFYGFNWKQLLKRKI